MKYLIAILLPPLAVLMCGKLFQALLNVLLTLCFYFPGMLHAILVVHSENADRRMERGVTRIAAEIRAARGK